MLSLLERDMFAGSLIIELGESCEGTEGVYLPRQKAGYA